MNQSQYNLLFSFIWNIATDVLVYAIEFIELEEKKNNSIDMFTSISILLVVIGLLFLVSEIGLIGIIIIIGFIGAIPKLSLTGTL